MADIKDIIRQAFERQRLDPGYGLRTAQVESGLNPRAQNPRSSAGGLFQFLDGTAKQYSLADKFDPAANAEAAARFTNDNRNALRNALGREPTNGELYLAHQQGAGGAIALLRNPDRPAADAVGAKAVSLNGGAEGVTAREFAALWDRKMGGTGPAPAGGPPPPADIKPAMPDLTAQPAAPEADQPQNLNLAPLIAQFAKATQPPSAPQEPQAMPPLLPQTRKVQLAERTNDTPKKASLQAIFGV